MKLGKSFLLAGVFVWAMIACSSAPKVEPAPLLPFKPALVLQKKSTLQADQALTAQITVDTLKNIIFSPQGDMVVAYDGKTGSVLWRSDQLGLIEAPVTVSQDGNSLLALVQGKAAVNLDIKTGKAVWRAILPAEMYVKPLAVKGAYVLMTADGRMIGLDDDSGRRRWAFARNIPSLTVKGSGAFIELPDNMVLAGLPGGKAIAIKTNTGQMVWETSLAESFGVNEVERISDVLPSWVNVHTLGYCAAAYRNRISCIDKNGQLSYTQEVSASSSLVASQSPNMFAVIDDLAEVKAWAFTTKSGSTANWMFEGIKGKRSNTFHDLTAQGDTFFISDTQGYIHGIAAKTGQTIVRTQNKDKKSAQLWAGLIDQKATLIANTDNTIEIWTIGQLIGERAGNQ